MHFLAPAVILSGRKSLDMSTFHSQYYFDSSEATLLMLLQSCTYTKIVFCKSLYLRSPRTPKIMSLSDVKMFCNQKTKLIFFPKITPKIC